MRPSPLQLDDLFFEKIYVETNGAFRTAKSDSEVQSEDSEFEGVRLVSSVDSFPVDSEDSDSKKFFVRLKFGIPNDEGRQCRFIVDAAVIGSFTVLSEKVPVADRENFVVVNGASLPVWGDTRTGCLHFCSFASGVAVTPNGQFSGPEEGHAGKTNQGNPSAFTWRRNIIDLQGPAHGGISGGI